jgi:hypothetical protein
MDDRRALDDDRLHEVLAEVLGDVDPVPADALDMARAVDLAGLDEQLAELVFDSLTEGAGALRVDVAVDHDAGDVRTLTFTADTGGPTIDLDLADGDLVGRISPPGGGAVEVVQAAGRRRVDCDEDGWFRSPVEPGPLRLRLSTGGTVTTTPWITR